MTANNIIKNIKHFIFGKNVKKEEQTNEIRRILYKNGTYMHLKNAIEFMDRLTKRDYDYLSFVNSQGFEYVETINNTRILIKKNRGDCELRLFGNSNNLIAAFKINMDMNNLWELSHLTLPKNCEFKDDKEITLKVEVIHTIFKKFELISSQIDKNIHAFRPLEIIKEEAIELKLEQSRNIKKAHCTQLAL